MKTVRDAGINFFRSPKVVHGFRPRLHDRRGNIHRPSPLKILRYTTIFSSMIYDPRKSATSCPIKRKKQANYLERFYYKVTRNFLLIKIFDTEILEDSRSSCKHLAWITSLSSLSSTCVSLGTLRSVLEDYPNGSMALIIPPVQCAPT